MPLLFFFNNNDGKNKLLYVYNQIVKRVLLDRNVLIYNSYAHVR